jgi:Protein of unknown function (DUF551)
MSGWRNIKKHQPTIGDVFLVFMPGSWLDRYSVQEWSEAEDSFSNDRGITHWMELPEPPKPETE